VWARVAGAAETRAVKMLVEDLELASVEGERATVKAPGVLFEVARGQAAALEALLAKVTGRALRVEIATDDPMPAATPRARAKEPEAPVQRRSRVIDDEPAPEAQAAMPEVDEPPFDEVPLVKETLAAFEAKLGQVNRRPRAGGTSGGTQ
jgi:hypothetical protein